MAKKSAEDKLKELAKEVTEKAEPYIDQVINKAEPYIDQVVSRAEPIIDDIVTKADPAIKAVKEKTAPAKDLAKKQRKKATDAAAKVAARLNYKEEIFVQYQNHEVRTKDIVDRCKSDYVAKGHSEKDIKEIKVYIKPSDGAAYYVVNNVDTGKLSV